MKPLKKVIQATIDSLDHPVTKETHTYININITNQPATKETWT